MWESEDNLNLSKNTTTNGSFIRQEIEQTSNNILQIGVSIKSTINVLDMFFFYFVLFVIWRNIPIKFKVQECIDHFFNNWRALQTVCKGGGCLKVIKIELINIQMRRSIFLILLILYYIVSILKVWQVYQKTIILNT